VHVRVVPFFSYRACEVGQPSLHQIYLGLRRGRMIDRLPGSTLIGDFLVSHLVFALHFLDFRLIIPKFKSRQL
jgi:hypothetical protein